MPRSRHSPECQDAITFAFALGVWAVLLVLMVAGTLGLELTYHPQQNSEHGKVTYACSQT
jgi:hypothetical protein